jgi:hypothetical protein
MAIGVVNLATPNGKQTNLKGYWLSATPRISFIFLFLFYHIYSVLVLFLFCHTMIGADVAH